MNDEKTNSNNELYQDLLIATSAILSLIQTIRKKRKETSK